MACKSMYIIAHLLEGFKSNILYTGLSICRLFLGFIQKESSGFSLRGKPHIIPSTVAQWRRMTKQAARALHSTVTITRLGHYFSSEGQAGALSNFLRGVTFNKSPTPVTDSTWRTTYFWILQTHLFFFIQKKKILNIHQSSLFISPADTAEVTEVCAWFSYRKIHVFF